MAASSLGFVPAYAKINLSLEVLTRRDDGYHELASVMQTISWSDTLRFVRADENVVQCVCDVDALANQENLALRAAKLAATCLPERRPPSGLLIELHKDIPFQAGLGGGSSDAACVLTTLNRLWNLALSAPRLEELGATLGSDVPFFIRGGTARITGRGEQVQPLPDTPSSWIVVAIPAVAVSTARVFGALTRDDFSTGAATNALVTAIRDGRALDTQHMVNGLERRAMEMFPLIAEARHVLLQTGAPFVRMSGSGSALFAPMQDLARAARVVAGARARGITARLARTISATEIAGLPRDSR